MEPSRSTSGPGDPRRAAEALAFVTWAGGLAGPRRYRDLLLLAQAADPVEVAREIPAALAERGQDTAAILKDDAFSQAAEENGRRNWATFAGAEAPEFRVVLHALRAWRAAVVDGMIELAAPEPEPRGEECRIIPFERPGASGC